MLTSIPCLIKKIKDVRSYWPEECELVKIQPGMKAWGYSVKSVSKWSFCSVDGVWALAMLVHGWMPVILRNVHDAEALRKFSRDIRQKAGDYKPKCRIAASESVDNGYRALRKYICLDKYFLTSVEGVSRSRDRSQGIVATSKYLHFLAPNIFPIIDKYVAKALDIKEIDSDSYINYAELVKNHCIHDSLPSCVTDWMDKASCATTTNVRAIEFILYLIGKKSQIKTET